MQSFKLGSRRSPLALKQVEEIRKIFPELKFDLVQIDTLGDKDKETPIFQVEGLDFFTREIDQALLAGKIDLALHSAKDLPDELPEGLKVLFISESISFLDAFVSRNNHTLKNFPLGWRIGTSSLRRIEQLKKSRPDLIVVNVRGNIQERLDLINKGAIDALIVAHAALIRLGLQDKVSELLSLEEFKTHPRQGSLAIVVKEKEWEKLKFILSEQALVTGS